MSTLIESTSESTSKPKESIQAKKSIKAKKPIQVDWWRKTFAGAILGLTLALALSGIFAWIGPGGIAAPQKVQFVMWIITPMWMIIFSLVYLFRSGTQALLWLFAANLIAYASLFGVRALFGAL